MTAEVNLTIDQGATFTHQFTWLDSLQIPIDLTGYTARMHMRADIDDATTLVELTTENGGISLGGVLGTIDLVIDSDVTAAFTWEYGVYDLEMISDAGPPEIVRRLVGGQVSVTPEVTR